MPSHKPPASEPTLPQLSWPSFGLALAITLVIFFGLHPLWDLPDMSAVDATIAWSYVPIPLLVLVLLRVERKLRMASFMMETVRLTLVKFVITFVAANLYWAVTGPPPPAPVVREVPPVVEAPGRFDVVEPPPVTPLDAQRRADLHGRVTDADGKPVAGAQVWLEGLPELVFAPRADGVELEHDGEGIKPLRAVVQVYERLILRGESDALHTVRAFDDAGRALFDVPLLPGTDRTLMFHDPLGRVSLRCSVHGGDDHVTELLVSAHPFAAWTGADGRFRFDGVPAGLGPQGGALKLAARGPSGGATTLVVTPQAGETLKDLHLTLP